MQTQTKLKVQLITDEGKWKYVGNAYVNKTGTINVYLDPGVTLAGGQKLHIRPAFKASAEVSATSPEPSTTEGAE